MAGMSKEEMTRVDFGEEAIWQIIQPLITVNFILTARGVCWRVLSKELM